MIPECLLNFSGLIREFNVSFVSSTIASGCLGKIFDFFLLVSVSNLKLPAVIGVHWNFFKGVLGVSPTFMEFSHCYLSILALRVYFIDIFFSFDIWC